MEPPPKQGCEVPSCDLLGRRALVSVEPPPKQGCEARSAKTKAPSLGLSGTPAEAGVRVGKLPTEFQDMLVSVEPPPKQGCEEINSAWKTPASGLSGTPAEAGVREEKFNRRNPDR